MFHSHYWFIRTDKLFLIRKFLLAYVEGAHNLNYSLQNYSYWLPIVHKKYYNARFIEKSCKKKKRSLININICLSKQLREFRYHRHHIKVECKYGCAWNYFIIYDVCLRKDVKCVKMIWKSIETLWRRWLARIFYHFIFIFFFWIPSLNSPNDIIPFLQNQLCQTETIHTLITNDNGKTTRSKVQFLFKRLSIFFVCISLVQLRFWYISAQTKKKLLAPMTWTVADV